MLPSALILCLLLFNIAIDASPPSFCPLSIVKPLPVVSRPLSLHRRAPSSDSLVTAARRPCPDPVSAQTATRRPSWTLKATPSKDDANAKSYDSDASRPSSSRPIASASSDSNVVAEPRPSLMRYAFAIQLALASVGFLLSRSPASLMKPKLLQEPGLSIELFSVISSINTMTMAIFSLVAGSFIDRFGGLRMLTVQLYGLALCNVAMALLPSGDRIGPAFVSGAWLATAAVRGVLACGLTTSSVMALRAIYPNPSLYADAFNIMAIGTRVGDTASRCFLSAFTSVTGLPSWRAAVLASTSIAAVLFLPLLRRSVVAAEAPADAIPVAKQRRRIHLLPLLLEMLRTPRFLLLATANGSVGLIAEIVTHWTDLFLYDVAGVSRNSATAVSSIASIVKFAGTFACGQLAARSTGSRYRLLLMQMGPMAMVGLSAVTMLGAMSWTAPSSLARPVIMLPMFALLVFGVQIHQDYILRYESLELAPSKDVAARVHTMMGLTLHVAKSVSALVIGQVLKKMSPALGWQTIFRAMVGTTAVVVAIDLALSRMATPGHDARPDTPQ